MKECVNCGFHNDHKYCPECGQKMQINRVTLRGVFSEFFAKWLGFDNQFARTLKSLFTAPGLVTLSYLSGNRVRFIGPLAYLVIMTTIMIFSFSIFGIEISDFLTKSNQELSANNAELSQFQIELQAKVFEFIANYFRFFAVILIPFWALTIGWFFRKEGYNYTERVVIASYLSSQALWSNVAIVAILSFTGKLLTVLGLAMTFLYEVYAMMSVFPERRKISTILRTFGSVAMAYVLLILLSIVIGIFMGIIMAIRNPEMFQQTG